MNFNPVAYRRPGSRLGLCALPGSCPLQSLRKAFWYGRKHLQVRSRIYQRALVGRKHMQSGQWSFGVAAMRGLVVVKPETMAAQPDACSECRRIVLFRMAVCTSLTSFMQLHMHHFLAFAKMSGASAACRPRLSLQRAPPTTRSRCNALASPRAAERHLWRTCVRARGGAEASVHPPAG